MTELRPKIGKPETLQLDRNSWVPNNQRFPVLIYHNVMGSEEQDAAEVLESIFRRNSGAMVSIAFTTIIRPHTKSWVSPAARHG
jgi:hypothetical protein